MPAVQFVPFAQLWKGEQQELAYLAAEVPDAGVIVEIGTAQGGTSVLMSRATKGRNISISTVDISPSPEAYKNLSDTGVEIVAEPSVVAADRWVREARPKIDLLFIDGGHDFLRCFQDFNAWSRLLTPGGKVLFHDYDPAERGGIKHLGVQIVIDAVRATRNLSDVRRRYKLFSGRIDMPASVALTTEECVEVLQRLDQQIQRIVTTDYSGWQLVCDDRLADMLSCCLNLAAGVEHQEPESFNDNGGPVLVSAHPNGLPLRMLQLQGIPLERMTVLDSFQLSHILGRGLEKNYHMLYSRCPAKVDFLYWAETIDMSHIGFGKGVIPGRTSELTHMTAEGIAKVVAQEQLRATLLSRMLGLFVGWIP